MEKKIMIEGMMCGHCKAKVEKAIAEVPGVNACTVDLAAKTATVDLAEPVADEVLFAAVSAKGFTPVKVL